MVTEQMTRIPIGERTHRPDRTEGHGFPRPDGRCGRRPHEACEVAAGHPPPPWMLTRVLA